MTTFDSIYTTYVDDVFRFIYKLSNKDHHLSEELTQDTFYHAWKSLQRFEGKCHIRTWLFQIAKNRYYNSLRDQIKKERTYTEISSIYELYKNDILIDYSNKELLIDSMNIIFDMPSKMKFVCIERIIFNKRYSMIATELGITESSAKVLFFRSKKILQKRLKEELKYDI